MQKYRREKIVFNSNYFKGWYFKCSNKENTISFIPAYHRNGYHETASLQIITDENAYNIPFEYLSYRENPLLARIGKCLFSENGIKLDINTDTVKAKGIIKFSKLSPVSYDIMGPFKLVPYMQCRHSVYSMKHRINGKLNINGHTYIFINGKGYIEGDRGRSFPSKYIWTQCFFRNGSIMLSVADIPSMGFHFTGIIGIVMINKKEYRIATYLGAKIKSIGKNYIVVKQGNLEIAAKLIDKNAHPLYAPDNGIMSRTIHESTSCKAYYQVLYKGKPLCEFISRHASFEFEY